MILLALALTWPKIIHVATNESGQADTARGFFFGVAMALNLLAVLLLSPRRRNHES
jgi:ABC-type transport system involved in cytochrome c biogenesis permease subunit